MSVMAFVLRSLAFRSGEAIPAKYTCDGENISPPLQWSGAPAGTRSFTLIVEDPDAPSGIFRHWAVYNLPRDRMSLPEGAGRDGSRDLPGQRTDLPGQAANDFGHARYDGPCPPRGHGTHHYHFRLAALDTPALVVPLNVKAAAIWRAAEPHIIAQTELVGTYMR